MVHEQRVQVVLGEAERDDGLLRFVLEGEGFDVVGLASNDHELLRVVTGARPDVVVLDAGISAPAAIEARKRADGAALVVVWPDGVAAVLAEERVDPFETISDLGDAVRRAAQRAEGRRTPSHLPGATVPTHVVEERRRSVRTATMPTRSRGRRGQLLIAAATWMLALTALTAIAIAVPNAMDPSRRHGGGRPSPRVSVTREPDERTTASRHTENTRWPPSCDDPTGLEDRSDRSRGAASARPVRGQGCRPDRGKDAAAKKDMGGNRPDDPGSQAEGNGPPNQVPGNGRGGTDRSQKSDDDGRGDGNAGNAGKAEKVGHAGDAEIAEGAGGAGKGREHGQASDPGRGENGNLG